MRSGHCWPPPYRCANDLEAGGTYADGDGVAVDKGRAYEYFRRLTMIYSDDGLGTPNAGYISNAFVMLGEYYLESSSAASVG